MSHREDYARSCGLENLETAEKIYSLFDGNEHFEPIIKYMRTAYRDAMEFLYINASGPEYDHLYEKIFKTHLDGLFDLLKSLQEIGEVFNPVRAYELFPPPVQPPSGLEHIISQIFGSPGQPPKPAGVVFSPEEPGDKLL